MPELQQLARLNFGDSTGQALPRKRVEAKFTPLILCVLFKIPAVVHGQIHVKLVVMQSQRQCRFVQEMR